MRIFNIFHSVALLALPILAAATTTVTVQPPPTSTPVTQCNTGPIQCCNSVVPLGGLPALLALAPLDIIVQGVNVLIGLLCSPILGGGSCSASPVCCQNNDFNGVVAIGCVSAVL